MISKKIGMYLFLLALCASSKMFGYAEVEEPWQSGKPDPNFESRINNDEYVKQRTREENWYDNELNLMQKRHKDELNLKNPNNFNVLGENISGQMEEKSILLQEHRDLLIRRTEIDRKKSSVKLQSPLVEPRSSVSPSLKSESGSSEQPTSRTNASDGSLGDGSLSDGSGRTPENLSISPKPGSSSKGNAGGSETNAGIPKSRWASFVDLVKSWFSDNPLRVNNTFQVDSVEAGVSYGFLNVFGVEINPKQLKTIGIKDTSFESLRTAQQIIKTYPDWRQKIIDSIQKVLGNSYTPMLAQDVSDYLDEIGLPMPVEKNNESPSGQVARQLVEEVSGKPWNKLKAWFRDVLTHDDKLRQEAVTLAKVRYSKTNARLIIYAINNLPLKTRDLRLGIES